MHSWAGSERWQFQPRRPQHSWHPAGFSVCTQQRMHGYFLARRRAGWWGGVCVRAGDWACVFWTRVGRARGWGAQAARARPHARTAPAQLLQGVLTMPTAIPVAFLCRCARGMCAQDCMRRGPRGATRSTRGPLGAGAERDTIGAPGHYASQLYSDLFCTIVGCLTLAWRRPDRRWCRP